MIYFKIIVLNSILILLSSFYLDSNQEFKSTLNSNESLIPNLDYDTTFIVDSLTTISQLKETFRMHAKNDMTKYQRYYKVIVSSNELCFKFAFKTSKISTNSHTYILDENLLMSSNLLRTSLYKWMNTAKYETDFSFMPTDKTSTLILIENNDFCITKAIDFQQIYKDVLNRYIQAKYGNINSKDPITQSKIKRLSTLVYQIVSLN
jgi:hypothetical protein